MGASTRMGGVYKRVYVLGACIYTLGIYGGGVRRHTRSIAQCEKLNGPACPRCSSIDALFVRCPACGNLPLQINTKLCLIHAAFINSINVRTYVYTYRLIQINAEKVLPTTFIVYVYVYKCICWTMQPLFCCTV